MDITVMVVVFVGAALYASWISTVKVGADKFLRSPTAVPDFAQGDDA